MNCHVTIAWAKGNLQPPVDFLCFGRRISFGAPHGVPQRIMAYVASPLCLAFLALTTVSAAELTLSPIEYFLPATKALPTLWAGNGGQSGRFTSRPEHIGLAVSWPKFLAIIDAIIHGLGQRLRWPWAAVF